MVPNARFAELLADIEPSPTTKLNASTAHTHVRDHLRRHSEFGTCWVRDFLAGSYSRDTAIRLGTTQDGRERPDVDIIVVTNYSTADSPDDFLAEVRTALEDAYVVERTNKRSVRVATTNADMDVVPVIETSDGFLIPDRDTGQWKQLGRGLENLQQLGMHGLGDNGGAADPVGQRRAVELHPLAVIHLRLAVQGQVVGVLGGKDMRDQPLGGDAALDQALGSGGLPPTHNPGRRIWAAG
jgi:hypothetical protein